MARRVVGRAKGLTATQNPKMGRLVSVPAPGLMGLRQEMPKTPNQCAYQAVRRLVEDTPENHPQRRSGANSHL